MKKSILCIPASNSKTSINSQLAAYSAMQIEGADNKLLDLNDFEMPIYSIDRENETGIPQLAQDFKNLIREADGIIISFAEHNSSFTAAYKNIYDWISRIEKSVWNDKPMLLLATSPGPRGARGILEQAYATYSRSNDKVVGMFSLPSFGQNFSSENGILDEELKMELLSKIQDFAELL